MALPRAESDCSVGTKKGAFILESDAARRDWSIRGPLCEGWPVHDLIVEPASGAILAAAGNPWYGPAVWRSEDGGDDLDAFVGGPDLRRRGRADQDRLEPVDDARRRRSSPASSRPGCSAARTAGRPGGTSRA